jgi:copper transport protein
MIAPMRAAAWLIALVAAIGHAPAAFAHASLLRSDLADRAVVARAPPAVTLTFNEPVSPVSLKLVGEGGHTLELRSEPRGETLIVTLPEALPQGTHLLSWRVISTDGHPIGGSLTFSIGQPSAGAPRLGAATDRMSVAVLWVARFLIYLALFVGAGGAFYAGFIARERLGPRLDRLLRAVLQAGLIAAVVSVGLQGADVLGEPLSAIRQISTWASGLTSAYGLTAALIVMSLTAAHMSLPAAPSRRRPLAALSLFALGLALAASGHASAASPQWLTRSAVFVHGVSVAFWAGALLPLAAALMGGHTQELARFSRSIPLPFAALVVSGVVLAVIQVRQPQALWTTAYGFVLCAKLAVVAVVLALAIANRRATPRALGGDPRAIQSIAIATRIEITCVALVLALVAAWRFTPPPRALVLAAVQPVRVHIHTSRAMADLQIDPADADGRRVAITLLDGEFQPLPAKEVGVVFAKPDSGIEPLRLTATHVAATIWQIDGVRLPVAGRWNVRVEILISDFDKIAIEDEVNLR